MDYTLTRSNRRTAAIYVREGRVEVRAPLKMPKKDIEKFIAAKEEWIRQKLNESNARVISRENFSLYYGDFVTYRARQYPIEAKEGNRIGFDDMRFYMPPDLTPAQVKYACVCIYRELAKRYIKERADFFAARMSLCPAAVKINGAKKRWGSCSAQKSLNFSWLLVMADDDVIDYVVVHELAHIEEMNHSARFWAVVENVVPNCKELKARLKALQEKQSSQDWDF